MGKASRNKRLTAREKIAAQQAATRRVQRRNRLLITGGSVVAVVAIVVALILVKGLGGAPTSAATTGSKAAAVVETVAHVPASTLNTVGAGSGQTNTPKPLAGSALTENGKPEVLYMGAEYCPYCAAERWAITVALSRFGTFSGVGLIHSSSSDVYASTPTLTFYKSSYTSKYVSFTPVELETVSQAPLQKATAQQTALMTKYDGPPYVPSSVAGSIPFVDIGNKYGVVGGSSYIPQVLHGLSWSQVASDLAKPSSPVAQQADGAANYLTAAICKVTSNQPGSVCDTPMIKTLQGKI